MVTMKRGSVLACLMCFALSVGCRSQNVMSDIAKSHIEANVPKGKLFDEYLSRDLKNYFCAEVQNCRVEYEFLRDGPTQTGIAYPKYYLWAKCFKGSAIAAEGAVRVAAVEQKNFDVTNFLSREEISESPSQVASIFPAPLVDKIVQRAHGNDSHGAKTR
jgi:hypothetical protein